MFHDIFDRLLREPICIFVIPGSGAARNLAPCRGEVLCPSAVCPLAQNHVCPGLGILPGKVARFDFGHLKNGNRWAVPHMGWNQILFDATDACPMLAGIRSGDYAYFAHSYHVVPAEAGLTATTTEYGYPFASSVWKDNAFATQFHPEKSQAVGLKLLENFVRL